MSLPFDFEPGRLPAAVEAFRQEVRAFLAEEIAAGGFDPSDPRPLARVDRAFSRRLGARGWIGMTWPKQYGGQERSFLERYVLTEELLVAGAPIRAHFVADRQSGPVLLRFAREPVKAAILPRIAKGELAFCIGMSEPDSGSDLFAAKAKAEPVAQGWRLNGRKVWTTMAHDSDYMIGLFRTSPPSTDNRRFGLSQFLVDLKSPGITVRPLLFPNGEHDFNEVLFEDVVIPAEHLLGEPDRAWQQATSELAFERSGPERYLETFFLLPRLLALAGVDPDRRLAEGLGRLTASLVALRETGLSIAGMLEAGKEPVLEASLFKEAATLWEQALPAIARELTGDRLADPDADSPEAEAFEAALLQATMIAPKLTIQGGTIEILRGIIARGLGLR